MKTCTKCNTLKSLDNFTKSSSTKDRLKNWCKGCFEKYDKERRATLSKEYIKGRSLVRYWPELKPLEAYNKYVELLKSQNNVCRICNKPESNNRKLCVDHCHKTNAVRGVLCDECNIGLGKFNDKEELLLNALKYLREQNENI